MNNQAVEMALWKGLELALRNNIRAIHVIGDSSWEIKNILALKKGIMKHKSKIQCRIEGIIPHFEILTPWHVMQDLNSMVDKKENQGVVLPPSHLSLGGEIEIHNLP